MHIDYAKEQLDHSQKQAVKWEWKVSGDLDFCQKVLVSEKKFLEWVLINGNEVSKSIANTILSNLGNKYYKITTKQSFAIADDISSRFKMEDVIEILFDGKERI